GVEAGPRREARHPQRLLPRVRLLPPAVGPAAPVAGPDHPGEPATGSAQRALRRPPPPLRADAVARELGALRRCYRPRLRVGAQERRQGDSGDVRAAATDVVGRRRPRRPGRRARGAREVGGVADERGHGRDPVAEEPPRTLAEPPPDLSHVSGDSWTVSAAAAAVAVCRARWRPVRLG